MKKWILFALLLFSPVVFAQENEAAAPEEDPLPKFEEEQIAPAFSVDPFIEIGKKTLFDASETKKISPAEGVPVFSWDFGDESRMQWGEKITHTYQKPGKYTVTLHVRQGREREEITKDVVVFDTKGILVSDEESDWQGIVSQAGEHGIWLNNIEYKKGETGFSAEEDFIRRIQQKLDFVRDAELIIFTPDALSALQSFAQFWQKLPSENTFDLKNKLWVHISDSSLDKTGKLLQPIFSILKPSFILLTRPEALNPIFETIHTGDTIEKLKAREIGFEIIDERTSTAKILFLSNLTTYFVSHGISQNVVYLLLAVPFIVFVIAFLRQFIGISTFGVYAPLMLALSFLVLGFNFGLMVFAVVMLVSYLIRLLFEKVELLYIPKVSLLLSILALSFFLVLGLAVYFDSTINLTLTIFPMLVMATLSEKFLSAQSSSGIKQALFAAGETVIVSFIGYFLVTWGWMESAILAMPELILLPIVGLIWLGRFTGLRLTEYFKFRTLFREEDTHEE
ncbi:PKD domain-containing protein [Candidatus Gracilibacteria bacterium]|nr:PKD domain-containing protein [Candidatus Gracilibacteria bacterium]MCF7819517.1 PKD domain-containing protein [Candidatus Gracilibacteria bacterium]